MWHEIEEQIQLEFEQLRLLLDRHPGLVESSGTREPQPLEIDALAFMLHGFYNCVENILQRIALAFDGGLPDDAFGHVTLLESMGHATDRRRPVISRELVAALRPYLSFRHVFRHAYSHQIRWDRMATLVHDLHRTASDFELQIISFVRETRRT